MNDTRAEAELDVLSNTKMTNTTATEQRPERRYDRDRPRVPITVHLRELTMGDGRKITVDRRSGGAATVRTAGSLATRMPLPLAQERRWRARSRRQLPGQPRAQAVVLTQIWPSYELSYAT